MTLPHNGLECSWVVPRWAVDITEVIHYIRSQMEDKKPNDFCCIMCVTEQWALAVMKLLSFFCINICCLLTRFFVFLYHVAWTHSSFVKIMCMCSISTPHKIRMFTVRLAGKGHGFAV